MKKIYCIILLMGLIFNSFAQLQPGDIMFTGYNSDVTKSFSFICLKEIPANTQIKFTDNGWVASGGFRTSEGILTWTSPTTILPVGTEVLVSDTSNLTVSIGNLEETNLGFTLSTVGDQIFAYNPNNVPDASDDSGFYAGIQMNSDWQTETDNASANTSTQPNALIGLSLAIAPERDNATYNCTVTSGSVTLLRTALINEDNWNTDNDNPLALGQCRYINVLAKNNITTTLLSIYPNPTDTGEVTISSASSTNLSVVVFDVLGKQINNQLVTNNKLNVSHLKSGVYILRITQNNLTTTKKLVIK